MLTELYKINREGHRFLGNEAENQQHFVAFTAPSSGQIWQIKACLVKLSDLTLKGGSKCDKNANFFGSTPLLPV